MTTRQTSSNKFGCSKWIVDPNQSSGTHTTIAGVNAVAVSGDTVLIKPGTYTEDPSPVAGVNYVAYDADAITPNVTVIGNWTFSSAGTISLSGICLQTNGAAFLTVSGSVASIVNLKNCNLKCTNATGISHTSSSASALITITDCIGDIGTTGISLFNQTSPGGLALFTSYFTNSGSSSTASTCSAGATNIYLCATNLCISNSSTNTLNVLQSSFQVSNVNVSSLTIGGAASVFLSFFSSGSAAAISIGGSATITNSVIVSLNTNAITGAGNLSYASLTFLSSTLINTTLSVTRLVLDGGLYRGINNNTAPTSGMIGEEIKATVAQGSAITLTTSSTSNVTSVSLTPGIWSVTGLVNFSGAVTGINFTMAVTGASGGQGTAGDSASATPYAPTANQDNSLTVASTRITLNATTTIYLTATAIFSVGTCKAYGRISALRVA